MTPNNNLSVLPFYTNIDEQSFRQSYAYGEKYPLYTPLSYILPFQIIRQHRTNQITSVLLFNSKGVQVANITSAMRTSGLQICAYNNEIDVIVYTGNLPLTVQMSEGMYYLRITDGVDTWYSDIFVLVGQISPFVKLEWRDMDNFIMDGGIIVYKEPTFTNKLYICTRIGKPDYEFEEEGENRNGYFFAERQLSYKTYRFTFLAPEYLCDVMRLIRMSDIIRITDEYGRVYECNSFLMTPRWQGQGYLASVEVEFRTDTVAKKIGKGYTIKDNGDFNIDFNNDYNNQ